MPFYSDKKTVSTFEHRDAKVELLTAQCGATHCELDHETDKTVCDNCGAAINSTKVILIEINGADIGVKFQHCEIKDAMEFAKSYIDDLSDSPKNTGVESRNRGRPNKRRRKKDPYSALLSGSGSGSTTTLVEIIKRLGWEGEGRRILNKYGGKSRQ